MDLIRFPSQVCAVKLCEVPTSLHQCLWGIFLHIYHTCRIKWLWFRSPPTFFFLPQSFSHGNGLFCSAPPLSSIKKRDAFISGWPIFCSSYCFLSAVFSAYTPTPSDLLIQQYPEPAVAWEQTVPGPTEIHHATWVPYHVERRVEKKYGVVQTQGRWG